MSIAEMDDDGNAKKKITEMKTVYVNYLVIN